MGDLEPKTTEKLEKIHKWKYDKQNDELILILDSGDGVKVDNPLREEALKHGVETSDQLAEFILNKIEKEKKDENNDGSK